MTEEKKRGRGRPPKYERDDEGVAEMQQKIDMYFASVEPHKQNGQHPTIAGLAIALGFVETQSLLDYQGKPEFIATVKAAKIRVQQYLENHLYGNNVTGAIFNLKNNFGMRDTQHREENRTTKVMTITSDEQKL